MGAVSPPHSNSGLQDEGGSSWIRGSLTRTVLEEEHNRQRLSNQDIDSSQTRDRTCVSCIGRGTLDH